VEETMNVATILNQKGRDVATASAEASLMDIVGDLAQHKVGAMVIVDAGKRVAGIISERDIVRAISTDGAAVLSRSAADFMTHGVVTCTEDDTVAELMERMTEGRFRHIPVVVDGELAGIVSIGDVVKARVSEAEQEAEAMRSYIATG
jgi:CBS domain-containing protein